MTEEKMLDQLVGTLMRLYRRSPLHSQKVGFYLAKLLAFILCFRKGDMLVVKEIDGIVFELDLRQIIDSSLYFSGTFEKLEEKIIESCLKPGMVALDIGANVGYHTFRMARLVQPNGQIWAIEPTSWAFSKLIRNANLNPRYDNITFLNVGLSDVDAGNNEVSFQSSYRIDGQLTNSTELIMITKLDTVIRNNNIRNLDFIKIDVDGFESKVIRGALDTLASMKPILLMEITPSAIVSNNEDPEALCFMLESLNYRFETDKRVPIPNLSIYCKRLSPKSSVMVLAIPIIEI